MYKKPFCYQIQKISMETPPAYIIRLRSALISVKNTPFLSLYILLYSKPSGFTRQFLKTDSDETQEDDIL